MNTAKSLDNRPIEDRRLVSNSLMNQHLIDKSKSRVQSGKEHVLILTKWIMEAPKSKVAWTCPVNARFSEEIIKQRIDERVDGISNLNQSRRVDGISNLKQSKRVEKYLQRVENILTEKANKALRGRNDARLHENLRELANIFRDHYRGKVTDEDKVWLNGFLKNFGLNLNYIQRESSSRISIM